MSKRKRTALLFLATATVLVVSVILVSSWDRIAAWYRFRLLFEPIGKNEQGYPEYRHRQTGIVMVRVPGGTFTMGSRDYADGKNHLSYPPHEVTLSPFLIAKYETAREAWRSILQHDPSVGSVDDLRLPVNNLTWFDCQDFCKETKLRLPTEAVSEVNGERMR